jgi:hypothetical protein
MQVPQEKKRMRHRLDVICADRSPRSLGVAAMRDTAALRVMRFFRTLAAMILGTALLATSVQGAPSASLNRTFSEFTGSGPIGNNNINDRSRFFWFYESSGSYGEKSVDSFILLWDPFSGGVSGTIRFDSPILALIDDRAELTATAGFQKPGLVYDYSRARVGLEAGDRSRTSFVDDVLTLSWRASNPGDMVRVLTASSNGLGLLQVVSEPQAIALIGIGLLALGWRWGRKP